MAIVYGNLRLAAFLALRRKTSRAARIVWPMLGLMLAFSVYDAFRLEPNFIQVTRHTIKTSKLPPGARVRVVQLADIHLSKLGVREIQMMNRTAREFPDVIVLTGDHSVDKSPRTMLHLKQIGIRLSKLAPTYAIEGNWDVALDMIALRQGGVHLLNGWTVVTSRDGKASIALGEIPWFTKGVAPPPRKLTGIYTVGLCHMPHKFKYAARAGYDLMLAGHTHGGQVRLPLLGALLPERRLVGKYQAGFYREGRSLMYVSRGIGMEARPAPQVRFFCRPEVVVIDIVGERRPGRYRLQGVQGDPHSHQLRLGRWVSPQSGALGQESPGRLLLRRRAVVMNAGLEFPAKMG